MLSSVLATAFAAVSSDGVRATEGVSAASAGRNGVPTSMAIPTIAYTISAGASAYTHTPAPAMRSARRRFEAIMTRVRR